MNLTNIKDTINFIIDNNVRLASTGKKSIAINLEGDAGIGKTSIVEEIGKERNMDFCKLVLSQCEEVGDIAGFPIKEYLVKEKVDDGSEIKKWVSEAALKTYFSKPCDSYEITQTTRMGYAPPVWLPRKSNPNGTILFLDDYSRANSMLLQSVMELIDRGQFMTWKLPENTTIILSSNPDDGTYNVSALDNAQLTRMCTFSVDFDVKSWATWAEYQAIDSRCINFALMYSNELFTKETNRSMRINARSYTMLANLLSGISDWRTVENRVRIIQIIKGCFNDEQGIVSSLFDKFINNNYDFLPTPEEMLLQNWDDLSERLSSVLYKDNVYQAHIAAILASRLSNQIIIYFDKQGSQEKVVYDRIKEFLNSKDKVFGEDHVFQIIKTIVAKKSGRCKKLMSDPQIMSKVL